MNPVVTVTGFWDAFVTKIAVFLPNFLFSVALIVVGWTLCNIIKRIVVRVLRVCQFDTLADRAGIKQALERGGIKQTASDIVGLLVFWFLFLIVIVTTLETLNLSGATVLKDQVEIKDGESIIPDPIGAMLGLKQPKNDSLLFRDSTASIENRGRRVS